MRKEAEGRGRRSRRRTQRASEGGAGQSAGKQRPRGNRASRPLPEEPVLLAGEATSGMETGHFRRGGERHVL